MMLDNQDAASAFEHGTSRDERDERMIVACVWGIEKNYIPRKFFVCDCAPQESKGVSLRNHGQSCGDFTVSKVRLDEPTHLPGAVDEGGMRGPAREGLDADRARTGAEVQETGLNGPHA